MMSLAIDTIRDSIKAVPNYPKEGIIFRDITSLLENPQAFQLTMDHLIEFCKTQQVDKIIGTEARGFIFAAPLALALNIPLVLVRKPHKLPRKVISETYALEYGTDQLEVHEDSIKQGDRVMVVDDLLATGGTILACNQLVKKLGGAVVSAAFVINLPELGGEKKLIEAGMEVYSIVSFGGK